MKKAMIGVIAVVVAAVVGCTVYEVASKNSNTTTAIASSVSNSSNTNVTESSTTEPSETASSTLSSTRASSTNVKAVLKDTISSKTESSTTKVSDSANKDKTASSKTESSVTQPSTTKSSTTKSSTTESSSATSSSSDTSSSNGNIINGQPVLFNNNSQVSSYYGTWTVGEKIGAAAVGDGASSTNPSGETLILTKSLYSFNGTVIENPNYYIIATNASAYFGSAGWTGNVGASNGVISFIIAVPSNVKVTAGTIYKYETQLKVIKNGGSLAIMDGTETVYSATL